jgi:3'(2'), 5'-bisphosphate nucleotidase
MEWDTAAAQCVLEEAGGQVLTLEGEPLRYNKDVLRNPALVSIGDPELPWQEWLEAATAAAR